MCYVIPLLLFWGWIESTYFIMHLLLFQILAELKMHHAQRWKPKWMDPYPIHWKSGFSRAFLALKSILESIVWMLALSTKIVLWIRKNYPELRKDFTELIKAFAHVKPNSYLKWQDLHLSNNFTKLILVSFKLTIIFTNQDFRR